MDQLFEGFLHVFRLLDLQITPIIMESQYWYTKLVNSVGIYFAVVVFPRDSFPTTRHADGGTIEVSIVILERSTITPGGFRLAIPARILAVPVLHARSKTISRHPKPATILNMITAREIKLPTP